jgi:hypothetical protein
MIMPARSTLNRWLCPLPSRYEMSDPHGVLTPERRPPRPGDQPQSAGTGWSFAGPSDKGKQSRPSPGGGRGNPRLDL